MNSILLYTHFGDIGGLIAEGFLKLAVAVVGDLNIRWIPAFPSDPDPLIQLTLIPLTWYTFNPLVSLDRT